MIPMFFIVSSAGLAFPNAPAIALNRHGETAGTAAALLGAAQFLVGGAIAPLVGLLDNGTAVPMAAIIVGTTGSGHGPVLVRPREAEQRLLRVAVNRLR